MANPRVVSGTFAEHVPDGGLPGNVHGGQAAVVSYSRVGAVRQQGSYDRGIAILSGDHEGGLAINVL
jgi:hypothetical protein